MCESVAGITNTCHFDMNAGEQMWVFMLAWQVLYQLSRSFPSSHLLSGAAFSSGVTRILFSV